MTNVIDGLSKRLDDLPADVVEDAVKAFTLIAERNGGKMMRGKYQLTAKPGRVERRGEMASVMMKGVPSGFWEWKESGTGSHVIRPKKKRRRKGRFKVPGPMGLPGHPVFGPVTHPGTTGSLKWTKTVDQADDVIADIVERALQKAVK